MTQHTPGPWEAEYDNDGNGSFSEWYNVGPARVAIYQVPNDRERAEADVRLIRATLPMLEALEKIAQLQRDKCEQADAETLFMILDNKVDIATAAIKAATEV